MAKRVNTRFLVGMVAAVVVMVGVFFIAQFALRKNAAGYMREGTRSARGDYKGAADSYALRLGRDQQNVEVLNKLGEAFNASGGERPGKPAPRPRGVERGGHRQPALRARACAIWRTPTGTRCRSRR